MRSKASTRMTSSTVAWTDQLKSKSPTRLMSSTCLVVSSHCRHHSILLELHIHTFPPHLCLRAVIMTTVKTINNNTSSSTTLPATGRVTEPIITRLLTPSALPSQTQTPPPLPTRRAAIMERRWWCSRRTSTRCRPVRYTLTAAASSFARPPVLVPLLAFRRQRVATLRSPTRPRRSWQDSLEEEEVEEEEGVRRAAGR